MDANRNENEISALPLTSEGVGFSPDELAACKACGRANPPTRFNCMYCGEAFDIGEVDAAKIQFAPRRLENWEPGLNVVATDFPSATDGAAVAEIAARIAVDENVLRAAEGRTSPLPLARVATDAEAKIVRSHLSAAGIESTVVPDRVLAADKMPARCRSIGFSADELAITHFNSSASVAVGRESVKLVVAGKVRESKTESTEKRKGRKSTVEVRGESTSEMPVIDIYVDGYDAGFRILAGGFDFSCLGPEKDYVAAKNIAALLERLRSFCPDAKFVSDYDADRHLLDPVWDVDERSDSLGMKRIGWGRSALANVTTRSNLTQFTKFSRLHRHLL